MSARNLNILRGGGGGNLSQISDKLTPSATYSASKSASRSRRLKPSGIAWLGDIPEGWRVKPLYAYVRQVKKLNAGLVEKNLLSLSYGRIKRKDIETVIGLVPANYAGYNIIEAGDIVLRLTDLQNDKKSIRVGLSTERGIVTSAYVTLRPNDKVCSTYLSYSILAFDIVKGFYGIGSGVRQGLNYDEVKKLKFQFPPLAEQHAIAAYLDSVTAKIDALREKIKREIERLDCYKKSAITEAVCHGLNPKAKMKDSGIPWVGKVPEGWKVDKIKYCLTLSKDRNPGGAEVLSLYREYGVIPKDSRDDNHNVTSEDTSKYRFVRKGDFVINKMKAWQGSMAVSDYDGIVSPAYYVYRFKNKAVFPKYLHNLLRTKGYATEFRRLSTGVRVGQWDLSSTDFENTRYLFPPLPEQREIAAHIDAMVARVDAMVAKRKQQLDALDKLKRTVVYDYVTGKKEVPR